MKKEQFEEVFSQFVTVATNNISNCKIENLETEFKSVQEKIDSLKGLYNSLWNGSVYCQNKWQEIIDIKNQRESALINENEIKQLKEILGLQELENIL